MKIQVNTSSTIEGSEQLSSTIEGLVRHGLGRFEHRLTRVEVHITDEDSLPGPNHLWIHCMLEARPSGMDAVAVTGTGDTIERACHDATNKMQSLLGTTFGRIDDRDGHATIRQSEAEWTS
jgi:hypothetical protein